MIDRVSPVALAATTHLVLASLFVLWSVMMAGRIVRRRDVPRALLLLTGLGALLIAPAAFVQGVTGSVITGRAVHAVAWLWPAASLVMLLQAALATARGFVAWPVGVVFITYDLAVSVLAFVRYAMMLGGAPAEPLVALSAAEVGALQLVAGADAVGRPYFLFPPVLAPAVPPRSRGWSMLFRGGAALLLTAWTIALLIALPPAWHAVHSFQVFARERLQERPAGDLAIGVRVFPDVTGQGPPDVAVTRDVALARELELTALSVAIAPGSVSESALDSVARAIDEPRRAGALLIAILAATDDADRGARSESWRAARLREMEVIVRRLRPDYVVPAAPRAASQRRTPLPEWRRYLEDAARVARRTRPRTRVMLPLGGFSARDSALYAWAGRRESPFDAAGFVLSPSMHGGAGLSARLLAAEHLMATPAPRPIEHWILRAGSWPTVFGERNQERALWGAITWASRQPSVRGVIVDAAADYGTPVGLRAVNGRIRPAARRLASAVNSLGEATERTDAEPLIR